MSKKSAAYISILFLLSLFVLNCGNRDATTSASQTPKEIKESKGLTNYTGTWKAMFPNSNYDINIDSEGKIIIDNYNNAETSEIKDLGNDNYSINVKSDKNFTVTLKFKSDTNGNIEDDNLGIGTLIKN